MDNNTSLEDMAASCCIAPEWYTYNHNKNVLESRFYPIPQETIDSINNIIENIKKEKKYLIYLKQVSKTIFKHLLGKIKVHDKEVPVYIGKFQNASYQNKQILIPYGDLDIDLIRDQIEHEAGHALDARQGTNWKQSNRYAQLTKITPQNQTEIEKTAYIKEPTEFDAMGSGYDLYVKRMFKDTTLENKQIIIDTFKRWLTHGDVDIPFLNSDTTRRWKTKPTLWRKLQQKVFYLLKELEKMMPKP